MSDEEYMEFIFPKPEDRNGRSTEVTSLPEIRRVMPKILVGDDFVGVSPMVGPTPETWELIRQLNKSKGESDAP